MANPARQLIDAKPPRTQTTLGRFAMGVGVVSFFGHIVLTMSWWFHRPLKPISAQGFVFPYTVNHGAPIFITLQDLNAHRFLLATMWICFLAAGASFYFEKRVT
ncbi:MAG TPA: hypothetical protein VHC73_11400 [Vitreimonas sp.]|jgi:hypothetical protein|nr:hypothetical protein [Vitreimonas sp.]